MNMKKAVSITLDADNLLWLKARAEATAKGSLSDVVDRLVREARLEGRTDAIRSVVGTVDLPHGDLDQADGYVRSLFDRSISRPRLVEETPPQAARTARARGSKRRG
jgi:hypothetical protein